MSRRSGHAWKGPHSGEILASRRKWFGATIQEVARIDGHWTAAQVRALEEAETHEPSEVLRYQAVIERLKQGERERHGSEAVPF